MSCESWIYANIENYTLHKLIITYNDGFHIPTHKKKFSECTELSYTKGVCFLDHGLKFSLLKQS